MRKFKTMLLSAGIAAVLALGGAVGAHLTTNDAPLRAEAASNITETTLDFASASLTSQSYSDFTLNGFKIVSNAGGYKSGYIQYNQHNTMTVTSPENTYLVTIEFFGPNGKYSPVRFKGPNSDWTSSGRKITYSGVDNVSTVQFKAGDGKHMEVNKLIIGTKIASNPNAFNISSESNAINFDLANPVASTVTVTPTNAAGTVTYTVNEGYNKNIVTVTNKDNVYTFTPGTAAGTTKVTLKANDTVTDVTLDINVTSTKKYTKIADDKDLKYGDVIVFGTKSKVFGSLTEGHYKGSEMKLSGDEANVSSICEEFVIQPGTAQNAKSLKAVASNKYLTTNNENFAFADVKNSSCDWTIEIVSGEATVTNINTQDKDHNIISWHYKMNYFNLYTKNNGIVVYKAAGNAYIDKLQDWVDTYMEMKNPEFEGNGTGACRAIYWNAKSKLVELDKENDGTMELFQSESTFAEAKLRYTKWAAANGDATPFDNNTQPSNVSIFDSNNNVSLIVIISVSVLAISGIAIFAITRRKKLAK